MNTFYINTDNLKETIPEIHAGDTVYLSGTVYTARDAAHKKIVDLLKSGAPLPFDLKGASVYYAGPTPEKEGSICGSFGPTTSSRRSLPYLP